MSIGAEEVLHVARLAELAVSDAEVARLTTQLNGIVAYVAQLETVPPEPEAGSFVPGPEAVRLREDVVRPVPLARGPETFAPEFVDGFFVVPRRDLGEEPA